MVLASNNRHRLELSTTEILGPYLAHVHIKNAAWQRMTLPDGSTRWQADWTPISDGQVTFYDLFKALRSVNYNGYLSFEDFSNIWPSEEKLARNIAYLKAIEAQ